MSEYDSTKLLYIEDNEEMSDIMGHNIDIINNENSSNVILSIASTGSEGIDKFIEEQPDMVLLDFNLPDMSGGDVLDKLKTISKSVAVIIVSGHDESYIRKLVDGDYGYLWKVDCNVDNINKLLDTV